MGTLTNWLFLCPPNFLPLHTSQCMDRCTQFFHCRISPTTSVEDEPASFCNQVTRMKLSCWLVGTSTSYFRHKRRNQKGRTVVHSHQVQSRAIWISQDYDKAVDIFGEVHGKFLSQQCPAMPLEPGCPLILPYYIMS